MLSRDDNKDNVTSVTPAKPEEVKEETVQKPEATPVVVTETDATETEEEKKQSINAFKLLGHNAKSTFFDGFASMQGEGGYAAGLYNILYATLLPVTSTLGAATKTVVDMATRTPLTEKDLETIKEKILTSTNEEFDQLVAGITKYDPRSSESRELLSKLTYDKLAAAEHLREFRAGVEEKMKGAIVAAMQSKLPDELAGQFSLKPDFKFTEKQEGQMENLVVKELGRYRDEFRNNQRSALIEYLDNEFNAGKKMEHVIKDSVLPTLK